MSKLVLIVDDDTTTQVLLQGMLKSSNYTPIVCSDGKVALEMLQALEFQLVLLDIHLPEVDGWEVLKFIQEKIERTSVLITTGTKSEKTELFKEENENSKYYGVYYKPFRENLMELVDYYTTNAYKKKKFITD